MLKKFNYIFNLEDIFDFLHSRFDNVRAKSNGNDIKDKRVRAVAHVRAQLFLMTCK